MKRAFVFALVALLTRALAMPDAAAKGIEDVVRANCGKEIVSSTSVSRNQLKSFTVRKSGPGYEMSGRNATNQSVVCKADADGVVKWVTTG